MPVSECKEPGIIAWQSSESCAGVPIKKRWFHLVRPPSLTAQTSSSSLEPDLQQKEQSNSKSESSSNAFSSAALADGIKSPPGQNKEDCDDKDVNLVQSEINPPEMNLQEPRLTVASLSVTEIGGNGKFKMSEKVTLQTVTENIELQLAPNEAIVHKPQEIRSEKVLTNNDPVKKQVNTELLLAPNNAMVPDVVDQNSVRCRKEEEKLDPQLWNLGLNKGKSNFKALADHKEPKVNLCANRSHWDLNTTMERWNNSAMVDGLGVVGGPNLAQSHDVNPMTNTTEKVSSDLEGTLVNQGKQVVVKSEYATQLFNMRPPFDQPKTEDFLHLSLNTASTLHSGSGQRPPALSSKLGLGNVSSDLNLSEKPVTQSNNKNISVSRPVKSEPCGDSNQKDLEKARVDREKAKCAIVKSEPFEDCLQESNRSSNTSKMESDICATVKSEPMCGFNQEILLNVGGTSQKSEPSYNCMAGAPISGEVPCSDGPTCPTHIPAVSGPLQLPTRLGLLSDAEAPDHYESPTSAEAMPSGEKVAKQVAIESVDAIASDLVPESSSPGKKSEVAEDVLNTLKPEGFDVVDSESSGLTLMANCCLGSRGNGEVAESDEEKISLSDDMQDDCSSDSAIESDGDAVGGTNSKDKHDDGEDDDYEDGEVREPLVQSSPKGGVFEEGLEAEHASDGNKDGKEVDVSGSGHATTSTQVEDKDAKVEDHSDGAVSPGNGEFDNIITKHDQRGSSEPCLEESLTNAASPASTGKRKTIKSAQRKPLDHAGKEAGPKGCKMKLLSDGAGNASQGTMTENNEGGNVSKQGNVEEANQNEAKSTILSKVETFANSVALSKDVNIRSNCSRIINLARACNGSSSSVSSLGRMRSIPGRLLPSQTERERLTDVVLSGDKLLPRGSRDDNPIDGQKFERQRNQDPPVGSTGSGFMHGRGRVGKHIDSSRGDWESGSDFGLDNFNGPTSFRFSGPKNASGVSAAKVECNGILVTQDGTLVGRGRGGRKPLNDELPSFRHPPRRRSPTGREGPVSHSVQMVRRLARDASPERCLGGGGPDLIALRHEEKFIRRPPDEMIDPMFSRPQHQYQRVGDPFVRGDRSFSPIQRRGPLHVTRIRSKSPPGSRARSPGPWSSPRRRSPDAFGRHDLVHRRASPIYRMERIRSPHQSPCFPEDLAARRHGSPPFMSQLPNDMRDMGPTREHDHPRFIPGRSPSGRVLPRSSRRFDVMDPREEMERDEYFGGHMPPGRYHELGGDEIADGRRILERRGVLRPFRPPFNGSDVENFRFHEGVPRSYRVSPEADTEFPDSGNFRVREFDRRVKNRPGNATRRTRSIEEQEENYRQGEHGWHDAGFEDMSRLKRRRF